MLENCYAREPVIPADHLQKRKHMQIRGSEAIRTQIQPSKQKKKREINKTTNSQNTKRTYGQPSEQLATQQNN